MTNHQPVPLQTYKRLLSYVTQYWGIFLLAIAGMVVTALSEAGFAALMKPMLNGSFVEKDPVVIRWVPPALIGIFLVRTIAAFISGYGMNWIGRNVILSLRNEMFEKLLKLPGSYYDHSSSGNTISKFAYDAEQVATASTRALTTLIRDTVTIIALLGWMFYLNVVLSLSFIVVGPIIGVLIAAVSKRFRLISRRIQSSMGGVSTVVEEAIDAQRVIKIFGGQEYEKDQFNNINRQNRHQQMKLAATSALSIPVIQFIIAVALAGVITVATMDGVIESIDVGTFMSFFIAMTMLFAPMKRLTSVNEDVQKGIAAATSIFELLDAHAETDTGNRELKTATGDIQYKDVCFQYDRSKGDVLSHIDLHIEASKTVAFVGRSGSGKTTLVNLLPRFYDIQRGTILIDGVDSREYTLTSLRNNIAYVGQDIVLFNDTIEHNIAYGALGDVDREAVINAATAAHAMEFIEQLPEGLDTQVGEKGVMLSGGQRQRIAIARALLKNAPILILDEATSALDTESERHIQAALEVLVKNRTTLVIAHRLSTIENADVIVVMDHGKIVEMGTHQELINKKPPGGGHYAALHQLQFEDRTEVE